MMRQKLSIWRVGQIILLACLASCQVAPDIDKVNSNYIEKALLTGEWYQRATVVDTQHNQQSFFTGLECDLDRVKWDITEKMLIAYRSYEKSPGTEGVSNGKQTMVAAFPITKHFDIRRDYNPVNGVQNNVIVENDTDGAWFERRYARIDWSTNLVSDLQCNDWLSSVSTIKISRDSSGEPSNPWRARVHGDYIETTVDAIAQADRNTCDYIGDWNCQGSNIKMKFSFMKLRADNDYEKQSYPDAVTLEAGTDEKGEACAKGDPGCENLQKVRVYHGEFGDIPCDPAAHGSACDELVIPVFQRFGFFRTERNKFDRETGYTFAGREQLVNRWNIWQQSKAADGAPIPLAQRTPKPIIYYLNVQFPEDLRDSMQMVANDWSTAFADTVAQLKTSCTLGQLNGYVDAHRLQGEMEKAGFGIVTEANLKAGCAALGQISATQKLDPIFFSGDPVQIETLYGKMFQILPNDCNVNAVNDYAKKNGLTASLTDAGISEVLSGNLEQACAVLEWASRAKGISPVFHWQQIGDLRYSFVNYVTKSELSSPLGYGPSAADPITGEIISAAANIYGPSLETYASWAADVVQLMNGNLSDADITNATHVRASLVKDEEVRAFDRLFQERADAIGEKDYLVPLSLGSIGENLALLRKTGFEDRFLVTSEMSSLFSDQVNSAQATQASLSELARPSNWARPLVPTNLPGMPKKRKDLSPNWFERHEKKIDFMGQRSACFLAETVEPAIADFALQLKGKSWDEVYKTVKRSVFAGVTGHEVGHTFGERHNFEASADALNYFPNFWGVDTKDHRTSKQTNSKWEVKYSSIMDYLQRFNGEFAGIGPYDKAAISFAYGNLVEIFDESQGAFVPSDWKENLDLFHYTDLPYLFGGEGANEKITSHYSTILDQIKTVNDDARIDVKSLGIKARPNNLFRRTTVPFDTYYRNYALQKATAGKSGDSLTAVPYKYCSDSFAWGGSLKCNRFDMGATSEEIVDNAAQLYNSYYLFNSFRRDRIHFDPMSYMARLYSRTFQPMLNPFRYAYAYRHSNSRMWPYVTDLTRATYKGLNFFGQILQTVEPGRYCLNAQGSYVPEGEVEACDTPVDIELGDGKHYKTRWSNEFFTKPENIGHMYDKLLAMEALTNSVTFFSKDLSEILSRGSYSIGYYRLFSPELIKLFSGIIRGDINQYSPKVVVDNGKARVAYQSLVSAGFRGLAVAGPSIQPSNSWIMKYYAMVFAMLNYSSTTDRQLDFAKRARIIRVGSKHDPAIIGDVPQALFTDPLTKVKYRALAPEGEEMAPGFKLLKEAQVFVNDGTNGQPLGAWMRAKIAVDRAQVSLVEAKRAGSQERILAQENIAEDAESELKILNIELYDRVQIIDMMRYLGDLLEWGA